MIEGGPTPGQSAIQVALRNFLTGVLPVGTPVVEGQDNRVPEPIEGDYVVFWPLRRTRLSQNVDQYVDAVFVASITGTTLDVTAVDNRFPGILGVGVYIFGVDVAANTRITALGTGTGGLGTYTVSVSQNVTSETMAAGKASLMQKVQVLMQCDVHGPNSSDNAQIITTALQDPIAERYFKSKETLVAPLYADDPRQVPFINGESQYETRWIVDIHLSAAQTVVFSQDFADTLNATPIPADATRQPVQAQA